MRISKAIGSSKIGTQSRSAGGGGRKEARRGRGRVCVRSPRSGSRSARTTRALHLHLHTSRSKIGRRGSTPASPFRRAAKRLRGRFGNGSRFAGRQTAEDERRARTCLRTNAKGKGERAAIARGHQTFYVVKQKTRPSARASFLFLIFFPFRSKEACARAYITK